MALKDVLRRYPDVAAVCVGGLGELGVHGAIEEPAARAAYVWILGQFGTLVPVSGVRCVHQSPEGRGRGRGRGRRAWSSVTTESNKQKFRKEGWSAEVDREWQGNRRSGEDRCRAGGGFVVGRRGWWAEHTSARYVLRSGVRHHKPWKPGQASHPWLGKIQCGLVLTVPPNGIAATSPPAPLRKLNACNLSSHPRLRRQDAPYLLEAFADTFAAEEPPVRLALLSAAAGLFFRRPPEAKPLLGAVLAAGAADADVEVRDRALLYYR